MSLKNKRLVLGTVQLGMKYGLNNTHGQPTLEESFDILDKALSLGIDTFDTAWAYGAAEDVLGAWIKDRKLAGKVHVISKMKPHALNDYPDGTKASDVVRMELEKSLKRLNLKHLDGYLFHSPYYAYMSHMVDGLKKAKKDGLVKNIGISIYDEPEALQAVNIDTDYIQVPYNAFDQRLDATDFFDLAKKNKVTVFARSPFLQGLLVMSPEDVPAHLKYLVPYLEQFISISKKYGISQVQAAMNFANSACRAEHIVFGVETIEQLEENIKNSDALLFKNNDQFVSEVKEAFKNINKGAINPSLWSKIKL